MVETWIRKLCCHNSSHFSTSFSKSITLVYPWSSSTFQWFLYFPELLLPTFPPIDSILTCFQLSCLTVLRHIIISFFGYLFKFDVFFGRVVSWLGKTVKDSQYRRQFLCHGISVSGFHNYLCVHFCCLSLLHGN